MSEASLEREHAVASVDLIIVGAGWAGMYMLRKALQLGLKTQVFEKGEDVGGTWYWNRYPGLRCDVESTDYSYSFDEDLQQEWEWSERFASQPEILKYAKHVADRFGLRPYIRFNTQISALHYDEQASLWHATSKTGDRLTSRFVVMASGCLSVPKPVDIPGLGSFTGEVYHTADWPHTPVDFTGKRVGLIGTGSSGIQVMPILAQQAEHLFVYQRTPSFSLPAHNAPLNEKHVQRLKADYSKHRRIARENTLGGIPFVSYNESALNVSPVERWRVYEEIYNRGAPFAMMSAFNDILVNEEANQTLVEFVAEKIRGKIKDPALAEQLIPKDQHIATRRLCIDSGYYEAFNQDNVSLVNLKRTPIERITPDGIETVVDTQKLDCIVFATGYDAMTGALLAIDIRGRQGDSLQDKWRDGPHTYLGLSMAGFPNLFTVTGPGSPAVLSNMFVSIEQHVEWIADCLAWITQNGWQRIEAENSAEDNWVTHVNEVANSTLFPKGNSWYLGANVPGKPRVFMPYIGGVGNYRKICNDVASSGYRGFKFS
ncbi:NAD(P)/FAD-dependent oxidoreductase [Pseudomonas sp. LTJR-52]|uniref:flavin-containing monooxygenase n=1 Tax=Pseudomonas sp. LTJR-52 TaxID=2479392 RepID=UPI000EFA6D59|nr:NAD(P)/FAD-dependent oxidoreductase [Pseudomonas sp. LTJR-52]AYN96979.1 NAD(P)/FAD-dependent oxidoreductase [Pseudomonas sp. LTJR-52]